MRTPSAVAIKRVLGPFQTSGRQRCWSICTSDTNGTEVTQQTAQACDRLLLLGSDRSTASAVPAQPLAAKAREARTRVKGQITPEAASVAVANNDQANAAQVAASKPPRP